MHRRRIRESGRAADERLFALAHFISCVVAWAGTSLPSTYSLGSTGSHNDQQHRHVGRNRKANVLCHVHQKGLETTLAKIRKKNQYWKHETIGHLNLGR